jgi:hypothetical protein
MYTFMLMAHSGWRYIALLLLVIAIVKFAVGWIQGSTWTDLDKRIGLFTVIGVDIQLLLGLILWGVGFGVISNADSRYFSMRYMEHPFIMVIAIAVMHIGWSRARKAGSNIGIFRTATITFVVTGLLVAVGVILVTGSFP